MSDNDGRLYGAVNADCLDAMKRMPDNSIDAIVTDPPYGLDFMGKNWDHGVPGVEFWKEALRVIKPGGHIVAFGGTRTYHRLACAIEDAGWEVRDCLGWLYSSGFPKSMDISKAIDKKLGAKREKVQGQFGNTSFGLINDDSWKPHKDVDSDIPTTPEAEKWNGWGTCLKPAFEPIVLARKPIEGTVADNVMKYGVGGINIDGCRVPSDGETICTHSKNAKSDIYGEYNPVVTHQSNGQKLGRFPANIIHDGSDEVLDAFDNKLNPNFEPIVLARKPLEGTVADNVLKYGVGGLNIEECRVPFESEEDKASAKPQGKATSKVGALAGGVESDRERTEFTPKEVSGRFPANIIHDGSEEVLEVFPSNVKGGSWNTTKGARHFNNNGGKTDFENHGADKSTGSAARFFYCAKASKKEKGKENTHPTVKPIKLMEYLVKLIAPKGSIVLDPFMGSGSTGVAALNLGRKFIGIEKEPEYFKIAEGRLEKAKLETSTVV